MPSYKKRFPYLPRRTTAIGRMSLDAWHWTHAIKHTTSKNIIGQKSSYKCHRTEKTLSYTARRTRAIRQTPLNTEIGRMSLNTGIGDKRWTQAIEQTLSNTCHWSKDIVQTISYRKTLSLTSRRSRAIRQTLLYTGIGRTPLNTGIGHSVGRKPSNKRHQAHAIGQKSSFKRYRTKKPCL